VRADSDSSALAARSSTWASARLLRADPGGDAAELAGRPAGAADAAEPGRGPRRAAGGERAAVGVGTHRRTAPDLPRSARPHRPPAHRPHLGAGGGAPPKIGRAHV